MLKRNRQFADSFLCFRQYVKNLPAGQYNVTAKFTIAASADGKTPAKDVTCVGSFRFYYTTE